MKKLFCKHCGESKKFKEAYDLTRYDYRIDLVDSCRDVLDNLEIHEDDNPEQRNIEITCMSCNERVDDTTYTDAEITELRYAHTDKKGKWHEKELPKEQRDHNIIEKEMINNLVKK